MKLNTRIFIWKITSWFEAIYLILCYGLNGAEEEADRRLEEADERLRKLI